MTELEKRKLERRVHEESDIIIEEYASLRFSTEEYLYESDCHVKKLLVCIMDVRYVRILSKKSPLHELESSQCVSDVFLALIKRNLISFLQISILKRIITHLCRRSTELQEKLMTYESNFQQYIQGRICKTTVYCEGRFEKFTACEDDEKVDLILLTDENWNEDMEFVKVLELEKTVAKCLGFNDFHLHLVAIQSECLKLFYSISVHIARAVFPLTPEELDKLASYSIAVVKCLDYHYTPTVKGIMLLNRFMRIIPSVAYMCVYKLNH